MYMCVCVYVCVSVGNLGNHIEWQYRYESRCILLLLCETEERLGFRT